ncbi:MAG: D-2-hydroxyacid dehydrogenase [Schleiferiaceae bacterium]|jgi:D-3-phosphoglycerate dehydrogenase|nr:MAG: 3-phosphoglycerate dehydrogenase [Cryomorphaceae bacterium BACL23 MAG-120924-bin60]MDP5067600.1 D-2-hydroxyacid dehydrogenase [Schleiferiaceae bacterium]
MKILANDGMAQAGIDVLERAGHTVLTTKVAQEQLAHFIQEQGIEVLLVRSATTARQELIDACPGLRMIGRGGVGMDNIDVDYARAQGRFVFNTPAASSESVAELVFAHLGGMLRFLPDANRMMPLEGETRFNDLKKAYAKGQELRGKTIGILGFGRIGRAVARMAYGLGMKVIAHDPHVTDSSFDVVFADGQKLTTRASMHPLNEMLAQSDIVTVHIGGKAEVLGATELASMKPGAFLVNAARGGVVNEVALLDALNDGHLAGAALDVFVNEPTPAMQVLMHEKLSLSPHIGAATEEAQDRIGVELAEQILAQA